MVTLSGCSELGPTAPQGPGAAAPISVEEFKGTLALKGLAFYSFSVESNGQQTALTLVDARENGVTTEALITIGLGTPRGTQCVATNVLSVKSGGSPQVRGTTNRGVHCALVFDPGNLTSEATFHLNITRPK
jgi:hypothetical protein